MANLFGTKSLPNKCTMQTFIRLLGEMVESVGTCCASGISLDSTFRYSCNDSSPHAVGKTCEWCFRFGFFNCVKSGFRCNLLLENGKSCPSILHLSGDNTGNLYKHVGTQGHRYILSSIDKNKLDEILNDTKLSDERKRQAIGKAILDLIIANSCYEYLSDYGDDIKERIAFAKEEKPMQRLKEQYKYKNINDSIKKNGVYMFLIIDYIIPTSGTKLKPLQRLYQFITSTNETDIARRSLQIHSLTSSMRRIQKNDYCNVNGKCFDILTKRIVNDNGK